MLKQFIVFILIIVLAGAGVFFLLTMPQPLAADSLPEHQIDIRNGETMFWAGGCASCHAAPEAEGEARLSLSGGLELNTPFGLFRAPNISPDPEYGIGAWSQLDFANAMVRGLAPDGRHYYPAFPYPYYQRMRLEDVLDLQAFINTLPAIQQQVAGHDLGFPFNIRRGLGLWKWLYLDGQTFQPEPEEPELIQRGRYLVQGPGHCGACHTPRDAFGGSISERYLAGAQALETAPDDEEDEAGRIPNITPHKDGIGDWSENDIAYALNLGLDPDFDSFGGSMVSVQKNMAMLSDEDRAAIAAYLKSIPALPSD